MLTLITRMEISVTLVLIANIPISTVIASGTRIGRLLTQNALSTIIAIIAIITLIPLIAITTIITSVTIVTIAIGVTIVTISIVAQVDVITKIRLFL